MKRIVAVIEREYHLTKRLKWRIVETFFFPVTTILIWGLFSVWAQNIAIQTAFILLAVNIFWTFAYQSQSGSNLQIMEDRWSESFKQIIITPLRPYEYLIGKIFFAVVFSLASFIVVLAIAYNVFRFNHIVIYPVFFVISTIVILLTSISLTILIASLINVLGNEYGFLSWSIVQLFMLFSAPFFPIATYPQILQYFSISIPYTWVFESVRILLGQGYVDYIVVSKGLLLSLIYLALSLPVYSLSIKNARKSGRIMKLW
jgi:ABC-2 type transport system permease protein